MIPILILAAGQSTRMLGRDKLLEQIDGIPLLRSRALAAVAVSAQVFVTLPDLADARAHARARVVADLPVSLIPVPDAASGMAASLRTGVAALPECDHFMVFLADLPEITPTDLVTLIENIDPDHQIFRGTSAKGTPGHPIIFHSSLRPFFANLTGDNGGKDIIATHPTKLIALPEDHATADLDTPEDWTDWHNRTNR